MSELIHQSVTYRSGCHMCHGLAVHWTGEDAKNIALKHANQTGHRGIWFQQEVTKVYNITEDMTMEDWDELERRPIEPKPPAILITDYTLGRRIRAARRAIGMTQAQLAEQMGMVRTTIIAIEQGERRVGYDELSIIADHIETTVAALTATPEGVQA